MSYSVRPANLFGQIGGAMGKGLAEQIPKEAERYRLRQGLEDLENTPNLSRFQKLARLGTLPGTSPTLIQGLSNLMQTEAVSDSYRTLADKGRRSTEDRSMPERDSGASSKLLDEVEFAGGRKKPVSLDRQIEKIGAVEEGPLSDKTKPLPRWSQQKRFEKREELANSGLRNNPELIEKYANEAEEIELSRPQYEKSLQDRQRDAEQQLLDKFNQILSRTAQKDSTGKEIFSDLAGEDINKIINIGTNVLKTNPSLNTTEIANDMVDIAKKSYKAKSQLDELSNRWKTNTDVAGARKALHRFEKQIPIDGNKEPYFNSLREKFGFSPMVAAQFAYPPSKELKKVVTEHKPMGSAKRVMTPYGGNAPSFNDIKTKYLEPDKIKQSTRDFALKVLDNLQDSDSILTPFKLAKDKDVLLDEDTYFDTIRKFSEGKLNEVQERELNFVKEFMRRWGDEWIESQKDTE